MDDRTCLIVSVGTGTGRDGSQSVAGAITFSVNGFAADLVLFVTTHDSSREVLPMVYAKISRKYEVLKLDDPDDINRIYDKLLPRFKELRSQYAKLVVDYTSGTKSMTGALCILATLHEADVLSYVTGERHMGTVVAGTEKHLSISPYYIAADRKLLQAVSFFNHCQFEACLLVLSDIVRATPLPRLTDMISQIRAAAEAYSAWDRFDHDSAYVKMKDVSMPHFDRNKAFLGRLLHSKSREQFLIADLLNNAIRRGDIDQKYDDAVARLYRTIEFIGQFRLKAYGIAGTDNIPPEKIPSAFRNEFMPVNGKLQVGLKKAHRLLEILGDQLGQRIGGDRKLQNLLKKRNDSILAHGQTPIQRDDHAELLKIVHDYAGEAIPELDSLLAQSTFEQWPQQPVVP